MTAAGRSWPLPRNLLEAARREGRQAWLATLPAAIRLLARMWSLSIGSPFQPGGQTAWVAPVRDQRGAELVLKVGWVHPEALQEADGLAAWQGHGAVQLVAAQTVDESTVGLLLERCLPGTPLATRPEPEQDVVVAGLLRRLWKEPPRGHPFRPLQTMCDQWADEFERKVVSGSGGLDPGLIREGIALFRSLPSTSDRHVLLSTDLHAENVLAAQRESWLVIDPKPYVGDRTYDPLQHMLNSAERLHADPVGLAGRMADLLSLDKDRLVMWLFARCVQESPDWPELAEVARQLAPR